MQPVTPKVRAVVRQQSPGRALLQRPAGPQELFTVKAAIEKLHQGALSLSALIWPVPMHPALPSSTLMLADPREIARMPLAIQQMLKQALMPQTPRLPALL
mmetsp:Transcript_54334/g.117605  ORF Transcript_54334/g.117605 Transcript_54334/m.117605 type:complete len:101 (+) Transcript_54334:227-529(+)